MKRNQESEPRIEPSSVDQSELVLNRFEGLGSLALSSTSIPERQTPTPIHPNLRKKQEKAAWKRLEEKQGRDRVRIMKRLAKHGGAAFRHFETVETRLEV